MWITSHRWDGWRLEIVTSEPRPGMVPVEPEEAELHPWKPEETRATSDRGFVTVEHLRAELDPRIALMAKPWDLLAIGPRGSGLLKSLHLGSTADWLLREPTSPLVIARDPGPVREILFAADGSNHSKRTLQTLTSIPWIENVLVRVVSVDDGHVDTQAALTEAGEVLEPVGARVEAVSLEGSPTHAIIEEIERSNPDLVAMGVRGVRGFKRLVVGSTTAAVAGATSQTILVAHAESETG
jgi:nucleotide-binding universal stress UspA family protein